MLGRIDLFSKNVTEKEIADHIDEQNRPVQCPEISQAIALSDLLAYLGIIREIRATGQTNAALSLCSEYLSESNSEELSPVSFSITSAPGS